MKTTKVKLSMFVVLALLILLVSLGSVVRGQNEGSETTYVVREIEISGNEEIADKKVLKELGLKKGDSISRSKLEKKVTNVRNMGVFKDVESDINVTNGEVSLTLKLTEYPVLEKYKFEGVTLLNTRKLKKALRKAGIKKGEVINQKELNKGLKDISKVYKKKGYPFVSAREINIGSTLTIEVIEGKLASVSVEGLETVPSEVALGMIEVEKGKPVKLRALQKSYQELQNSVYFKSVELVPARGYSKSDIILRWKLTERKVMENPAEASELELEGNTLYSDKKLRKLIREVPEGQVSNYDLLKILAPVYNKYLTNGYRFVDFSVNRVENSTIFLEIFEGKITELAVKGNEKTARKVITNKILLSEGDVFNSNLMKDSRRRLLNLGYFSKVEPKPVKSSKGVKLTFTVKEKTRLNSANGGLTWSGNGLAGKLRLSTKNIFGLGQDISLNLNRKFSLDAKFGGSLDWKNVYYPSGFNFTKLSLYRNVGSNQGVKASFGYPLTGNLSLNMGYNADWILGDSSEGSLTHILSADLVYDDRNNPMFPTDGSRRSLKLEKAGDFAPGLSFTQLTFKGSYFEGLPSLNIAGEKKQVFGFNLQLGLGMEAPQNYQSKFGGKNSIRGTRPDVASNYGFFNSEYRLQLLPGSLYLSSFVDSGVKFGTEKYDFKTSAGLEINLQIFGHLRIGAAWELSKDISYVPSFYFSMGPMF
ncbi:MAG: outer membrane protein assembly factor [Candidatus Bipolaricaulia bacterium]